MLTFPAHIPINTTADVHFLFVSPAVFCASQAYTRGVMAARQETCTYIINIAHLHEEEGEGSYQIIPKQKHPLLVPRHNNHQQRPDGRNPRKQGNH